MAAYFEKRGAARVPIENVTVEIRTAPGVPDDSPEICSIFNISETGMLFEAGDNYPPGQSVRLTFVLPGRMEMIRTDATVIHSRKVKGSIHVGVAFTQLGTVELREIRQFVEHRQ